MAVQTHGAAPCAVVAAARWDDGSWVRGLGAAGQLWEVAPDGEASVAPRAGADTVFDLASLTKPVTALLLARLERKGIVSRSQTLGEIRPELAGTPTGGVTLDVLLAHRSGLEAHIEFFIKRAGAVQASPETVFARAAAARRAECGGPLPPSGFDAVYSDLGYILAGAALERAGGASLGELVERELSGPLNLQLGAMAQLGAETSRRPIAPTEQVAWRGGVLRGVVHDENAWILADSGSAGHAGMFGDAQSVAALGIAVVDALCGRGDGWLRAADIEPLIRRRRPGGPGQSYCSGFERRTTPHPSSGDAFGAETFGHLGFTGTSLWIDPDAQLVGVLLTNRVHPTRDHLAIRTARPVVYDAIFRAMTS